MRKLTPILVVDSIEECLPFWADRIGFDVTAEVPHGDRIGFVILSMGDVELMMQSRDSLQDDLTPIGEEPFRSYVYLEVGDLDEIAERLEGIEPIVPERKTFYGAREIIYRGPGGHIVTLAEMESD